MSKRHPSPTEERWRWHHRRCRYYLNLLTEERIGDPLGIAAKSRRSGDTAELREVIRAEGEALGSPFKEPPRYLPQPVHEPEVLAVLLPGHPICEHCGKRPSVCITPERRMRLCERCDGLGEDNI